MDRSINAHFDGKVIVPDEPIELPVGLPLRVRIVHGEALRPQFEELLDFGVTCPELPSDLSEQHDHYLYGIPKQ